MTPVFLTFRHHEAKHYILAEVLQQLPQLLSEFQFACMFSLASEVMSPRPYIILSMTRWKNVKNLVHPKATCDVS